MKNEYYKIVKIRKEYLGVRYFSYNRQQEKVVQVCYATGDVKKGKSNSLGVYLIHKVTFVTNYLSMGYVEKCTKAEYEKMFTKVIETLK